MLGLKRILLLLTVIILAATSAFSATVRRDLAKESGLEQVLSKNRLRVGFSTFVPWAMKNKKGEFVGFEIDVARKLATDMGVEIEFVPTKWSGIIPALLTGKFDVLIGGMGITPERNLKVNFTDPYEFSGMSIVASNKLPGKTAISSFDQQQVTIVARIGTTAAEAAKKYLPHADLRLFDDEGQALQEVLNGRAMAMVASQPFPEFQSLKYPERLYLPLGGATFTKEPIGIAIGKGDIDFLNFLNNWIRVRQSDGWLQDRFNYWFTTQDWQGQM
jgi:polar amino acid transport system substrate-binding protein